MLRQVAFPLFNSDCEFFCTVCCVSVKLRASDSTVFTKTNLTKVVKNHKLVAIVPVLLAAVKRPFSCYRGCNKMRGRIVMVGICQGAYWDKRTKQEGDRLAAFLLVALPSEAEAFTCPFSTLRLAIRRPSVSCRRRHRPPEALRPCRSASPSGQPRP